MSNFTRFVAPPYHFDHDGAPLLSYLLARHRKRVIEYVSLEPELNYDKNSKVGPSVQHIQNILDNTDFMLRMYGSASELSENLKIYRNFLGNSEYFQDDAVSYCTTPTIYHSLKNEEYICKSDLFPYLQNLTLFTHKELSEDLFLPFITVYLKSKEKAMIGKESMEFVRFKPHVFEEIEKEFGRRMEIFGKTKLTNDPKTIKTIRLFEDGDYRFAILSEVCSAANIHYVDHGKFSYDLLHLEQIQSLIKEQFNTSIEFIRCPIRRAKHKAVPIKASNGFAVLAVDALFDVLRNFIFGSKLFQNGKKIEEIVSALFKELERGFTTNLLKKFLHSQNACGRVLTLNCYSCKADGKNTSATVPLTPSESPPNPPQDVVQEFLMIKRKNQKMEMISLNKDAKIENFSEILSILNAVTSGGILEKKSSKSTSSQKDSGVVSEQKSGKKAPKASEKPKSAPDSTKNQKATATSLDSESPASDTAVKPKKNQKKAPESAKNQKATSSASSSVDSESSKLLNSKKAPESAKNQKSSSEAPPPPKKESANCVKCYRTCEMLNETKKELKSTQNKLAMYEKKNLEMEKEKKKKNERILEEQKEKIAKLQKGLEAKNTEIEELNKGIEKKAQEIKAKRVENEKILERKRLELEGMAKEILNLKKIISQSTGISHENLELKNEISSLKNTNSSQKQSFLAEKSKLLERMGILETENHTLKQRSKELGGARILERTRENQRVHVGILKLKTENRTKERVIQQLMDRLANSVPIGTTSGIQNPIQNPLLQNPNPEDVTPPPYLQQYPDFETAQYPDAAPEAWDPYAPEYFPQEDVTPSESPFFLNNFCKVTSSRMTPDAPEFIPASRSIQTATPWFDAISSESATSSSSSAAAIQKSEKSESADSECPICLDEVASNEKKINCHQCKKRFHSHCASTWLRVKSECPACRGRLLDPNEFPTLS
ncbi:hypothetical protein CRE_10344 [Caenorhabditis remanei]|uniref:RING-type domain-containing protein n=1 Tax=Caenorhabditis remanei TaxID=31234 RepID=E3MQG4_CAERE|nr:hypothetical protein CRE_10344 [Caenorhabditis remanei]